MHQTPFPQIRIRGGLDHEFVQGHRWVMHFDVKKKCQSCISRCMDKQSGQREDVPSGTSISRCMDKQSEVMLPSGTSMGNQGGGTWWVGKALTGTRGNSVRRDSSTLSTEQHDSSTTFCKSFSRPPANVELASRCRR